MVKEHWPREIPLHTSPKSATLDGVGPAKSEKNQKICTLHVRNYAICVMRISVLAALISIIARWFNDKDTLGVWSTYWRSSIGMMMKLHKYPFHDYVHVFTFMGSNY